MAKRTKATQTIARIILTIENALYTFSVLFLRYLKPKKNTAESCNAIINIAVNAISLFIIVSDLLIIKI